MSLDGLADFRSDTVTRPTREMYAAMAQARLGDDVLGDDPTVKALEEEAAARFGKEAAVFVPSGTMANQAALMAWLRPGDEVILEAQSHTFNFEGGGVARLAGAQARPLPGERGRIPLPLLAETLARVRPVREHQPRPRLLSLENTHNLAGGAVLPLPYLEAAQALAREQGLRVHLDGARIFNAAVASGTPPEAYGRVCDSLSFCLSKGLACPVGSLLVGPADFIAEARRARKVLGGGMRQAGLLAACGLVALRRMVARLAEDHARARRLAEGLAELPGLQVTPPETNIVCVTVARPGGAPAFAAGLRERGVLGLALGSRELRLVTHKDVDDQDVERLLRAAAELTRG